ncbi:MAG: ATP-dependent RNA helicase A [bacterium]|nr:MAG: ATP-dependent RNA helicase A [bacterium]
MRMINLAAVAALAILAASPAFAGDRRGGGHPGGGHPGGGGSCGGSCGAGGGHQPPPYTPPPPHGGGFNSNINVNVNANANANANAGAAAGGYFNARTYDMGGFRGGFRGGGYGGGTVYVGGGYGGDGGGYYGGGAIYTEEVFEGRACASAPFGYVVNGFGRTGRRAPACVANTGGCEVDVDRGGRYGHSERHSCGGGRREDYGSYQESRTYESREEYREETSYGGGYTYVDDRGSYGGHDCDCDHGGGHDAAPYPPPYAPEPPRYEPPAPPARPYRPERPRPSQPPRQHYSQEPGERG